MPGKIDENILLFSSEFMKQRGYWLNKLSGDIGETEIFNGNRYYNEEPISGARQNKTETVEMVIPDRLSHQIIQLGNQSHLTIYIILLAGLKTLAARYMYTNMYPGIRDIIVGSPVYEPRISETTINNLVYIRDQISDRLTFKEILLNVSQSVLEAYENQDYPFAGLLEYLAETSQIGCGRSLSNLVCLLENIHDTQISQEPGENIIVFFTRENSRLRGVVIYSPGKYEKHFPVQFAKHFVTIMEQLVGDVNRVISEVSFLYEEEKRELLYGFNRNKIELPMEKVFIDLFQEQVARGAESVAVVYKNKTLTYEQLNQQANQLANYLVKDGNFLPDQLVGILMDRSELMLIAILGIFKAGGAYVPIDPDFPGARIKAMIDDADIAVVLSEKKYIKSLNRLQWECPSFEAFLCTDSWNVYAEEEVEKNEAMDKKLWEYIGETATDEITGGGWITSYTGEPFTREEMDEYGDNALKKMESLLHKDMRVLEIGCASGITMFRLAPRVGFYYAVDLSKVIIEKNLERIKKENLQNITLSCLPMHEIDSINERDFDLVVINSVIQDFHGLNYLKQGIGKVIDLMADQGVLFIGDVMDQDLKDNLVQELMEFKRNNRDKNYRTKTEWSAELFVSKGFFEDLLLEIPGIQAVEFSDKIYTIENELTKFRYDALFRIDKNQKETKRASKKHKYQHDLSTLESYGSRGFASPAKAGNLAYAIYTSGSTGKPKGAMVEHMGMLNHLLAKINELQMTGNSVVAQNASHCFDISVWQFLAALLKGGKTVIYPHPLVMEPDQFINRLIEDRVTLLEVVPSYLEVFLDALAAGHQRLEHLDYLLTTGEAVKPGPVRRCFIELPGIKVVNAYGPTEAADDITHHILECAPCTGSIPIGKPLQNLNIYIVDKNMKLCPVGVKGEICVSGVGVGRGYLNDQERIRQVFAPDPFAPSSPTRLYKTGDLGCWLPDGTIDFFGRIDHQVKIRGFRIELGEIESRLVTHEDIKDAVVIEREDDRGGKYLCAFLVLVSEVDSQCDESEIKDYLLECLPDYMVPSHFVRLQEMPLLSSGKVNRNALAEMEIKTTETYVAPGNEVEEQLVEIFKSVLGQNQVGVDENFFMIGGDSIKAIQIVSRIHKVGYKVEVRDIFQTPTISQLAPALKRTDRTADQSAVTGKIALTPVQKEFFTTPDIHHHYFNHAVLLYSEERLELETIKTIFLKIQQHHDALRMVYKQENSDIIQINQGTDHPLSLQEYDLRNQADAVEALGCKANEIQASINLEKGSLMKLGLFHLDDGDRLLIIIHHLAVDGVSWRILFEDINGLYQQYKNGEKLELPLKTDSFKLWAEKLVEYANNERFLEEKAYWKRLESACLSVPPIRKDFDVEDNFIKDIHRAVVSLSEKESNLLLTTVNEPFGTEINDILLTGLGVGISKTFGVGQVLIILEGHGREEIFKDMDINRTVGWFTCLYPVLLDISYYDTDLGRQIKEVKECLHQVPQKGIGYGILKYLTAPELKEDMESQLLPQVGFNYWGQFDADLEQMSFSIAGESTGNRQSSDDRRPYELEVSAMMVNKRMELSIVYSRKQFKRETIEQLLHRYQSALSEIISYCTSQQESEITPSDLTYKQLSIDELDSIFDD